MGCLIIFIAFFSSVVFISNITNLDNVIEKIKNEDYRSFYSTIISFIILVSSIVKLGFSYIIENQKEKEERLQKEYERALNENIKLYNTKKVELEKKFKEKESLLEKEYKIKNTNVTKREEIIQYILSDSYPFRNVASLKEDVELMIYDKKYEYLKKKSQPALKAAEEVKLLKEKTKGFILQYKEMKYRYDYLLWVFPELKRYVEDEQELKYLESFSNYIDLEDNRDKSRDYLSKDEWEKLDENQRNQLALDRYKNKEKSKWVIGIEYEMYVDYILREQGYRVIPYGSINGIEDLGRDLIAFKRDKEGNLVAYIIQCKNWSIAKGKEIHENVICQTFGTAIEYELNNKGLTCDKVVPVICTTVKLSEVAKKFAERLGVMIVIVEKKEYPMIKCNINNNGNKIYHLPFDQQYYRTQICKPGEFYAWTVKEAVNAGFRRAFKYKGIIS